MSEFRVMFGPRDYATTIGGPPLAALAGRNRDLTRYRTPIVGPHLTGAATVPGADVSGGSEAETPPTSRAATCMGR